MRRRSFRGRRGGSFRSRGRRGSFKRGKRTRGRRSKMMSPRLRIGYRM